MTVGWILWVQLSNHDALVTTISTQDAHAAAGLILGLRSANERRRYFATTSLIGQAQA